MTSQLLLSIGLFILASFFGSSFKHIPFILSISILLAIMAVVKISTLIVLKTLVGFGIIMVS